MRRLEDGTYMYDTESPWDYVITSAVGVLVLLLGVVYRLYQVIVLYKESGLEEFRFLSEIGTSHVIWIGVSAIWIYVLMKYIFRQSRSARGGKRND